MRKVTKLPHRNRKRTARLRAKLKRKLTKVRLRKSKGERKYYR